MICELTSLGYAFSMYVSMNAIEGYKTYVLANKF